MKLYVDKVVLTNNQQRVSRWIWVECCGDKLLEKTNQLPIKGSISCSSEKEKEKLWFFRKFASEFHYLPSETSHWQIQSRQGFGCHHWSLAEDVLPSYNSSWSICSSYGQDKLDPQTFLEFAVNWEDKSISLLCLPSSPAKTYFLQALRYSRLIIPVRRWCISSSLVPWRYWQQRAQQCPRWVLYCLNSALIRGEIINTPAKK